VFDPGLGLLRAGFLVSRYGFNFRASAKTNSARKIPRRVGRTYSRWKSRVKANRRENRLKSKDLADFGRGGTSAGLRHPPMKPTGSIAVVLPTSSGQGQHG
jgi:predicted alpha/beta-hydrolase family hydrolase